MRACESHQQPALFAPAEQKEPLFLDILSDEILALRRVQANNMLKMVQEATVFPWKNLTVASCEEMRFNAMARLFPPAEGTALLEAFATEITRLYDLIDEPWMPLYYSVLQKLYAAQPNSFLFRHKPAQIGVQAKN